MAPKVLVLGATGFVGFQLSCALLQAPDITVIGTARPASQPWRTQADLSPLKHKRFCLEHMDLSDPPAIEVLFESHKPTHVINATAYGVKKTESDARMAELVNRDSPSLLFRLSEKHDAKRFIHLGSYFEVGNQPGPIKEDASLEPASIYARTKAEGGTLLLEAAAGRSTACTILRLFNLWGPLEEPGRLVPLVIEACREQRPLALTSGAQQKDYVYLEDLASWAAELTLSKTELPSVVNMGSGRGCSVRSFATRIAAHLEGEHLLQFGALPNRSDDIDNAIADTQRLDTLLPERRETPLEIALERTLLAPSKPRPEC